MSFKNRFNIFLQFIYKLFASVLTIAAILLIVTVALVIGSNSNFNTTYLYIIVFVSICLLFYLLKNRRSIRKNNKKKSSSFYFFEIVKLAFGTFFFGYTLLSINKSKPEIINIEDQPETVVLYTDSTETTYEKYYLSKQTWLDFKRRKHKMPFKVDYYDVEKAREHRGNYKANSWFTWNKFYDYIISYNKPFIEDLAQNFSILQKEHNLNRKEFAELIITSIQDIPYHYVKSDICETNLRKPCIGNIKYGMFTPAEFVANLKGDCDTRTVILFSLLSKFNYEVAILNSDKYLHSMLGLYIPSTGKYKEYRLKKYYFVETTTTGCPIGYMPPEFYNINYWDFVLINNLKI